jgi:hypothetical protein
MYNINNYEIVIKILINTLFISVFLCIFFFTYAAYVEKNIIYYQMKFLSNSIKNDISVFGPIANNNFKLQIANLQIDNMDKQDAQIKNDNKIILYKAIKANIIFTIFISVLVGILYSYSDKNFKIKDIIIYNLVILFFIALTEFCFLTFFGSQFISIDPNEIKLSIIKNIQNIKSNDTNNVNTNNVNTNNVNTNNVNTNNVNQNNVKPNNVKPNNVKPNDVKLNNVNNIKSNDINNIYNLYHI